MHRRIFLVGTLASIAVAGGCQSEAAKSLPPSGICDREAAAALVGLDRVSDDKAKQLTGATVVRQIKPGDPVTMDFRQERVTIETDLKTGKIVRASCG